MDIIAYCNKSVCECFPVYDVKSVLMLLWFLSVSNRWSWIDENLWSSIYILSTFMYLLENTINVLLIMHKHKDVIWIIRNIIFYILGADTSTIKDITQIITLTLFHNLERSFAIIFIWCIFSSKILTIICYDISYCMVCVVFSVFHQIDRTYL